MVGQLRKITNSRLYNEEAVFGDAFPQNENYKSTTYRIIPVLY